MAALILYITGQTVTLYRAHRKGAENIGRFNCDDAGYMSLCEKLLDNELQPVSLLVDLIEEEFRQETLPHILGRDRRALHARQAGKLYRTTPFRHHRAVGREAQGRRDDRILFSALTNRENIEPLLGMLNDAGVPVTGVYSLPIITRHLIRPLGAHTGNALLVTRQPDEGLRETFVRDGQVLFSRLAPVSAHAATQYGRILSAEARKTRRYLHTLRLLPHDQPLDVFVLCDSERLDVLQALPDEGQGIQIQGVNIAHLAQLLGFQGYPDTGLSDALFSYLLYRHRSANHYARNADLRNWRTHLVRQGMRAATWLIAVGAVTLSGMNVVDSLLVARESRNLVAAASRVSAAHQRVSQRLPVTPDKAHAMHEAIAVADRLDAYPVKLERLYRLIGDGFNAQPGLAMDRFSWFVAANPAAVKAVMPQQGMEEAVTLEESPYLVTRISGHVRDFSGNYTNAQRQLVQLVGWLSTRNGVRTAEVIRSPLDTRADNNLQGGMALNDDRETAEFELRIVLELKHEPV